MFQKIVKLECFPTQRGFRAHFSPSFLPAFLSKQTHFFQTFKGWGKTALQDSWALDLEGSLCSTVGMSFLLERLGSAFPHGSWQSRALGRDRQPSYSEEEDCPVAHTPFLSCFFQSQYMSVPLKRLPLASALSPTALRPLCMLLLACSLPQQTVRCTSQDHRRPQLLVRYQHLMLSGQLVAVWAWCLCNRKQEADWVLSVCSDTWAGTRQTRWPINNRSLLLTVLNLGKFKIKVPDLNCFLDHRGCLYIVSSLKYETR